MRKLNAGGVSGDKGNLNFLTTNKLTIGSSIIGTYLRTIVAGKKKKANVYIVRLSQPFEYQGRTIAVGTDVGVNTDGLLSKHMPEVPAGTEIELQYLGKKDPSDEMSPHGWNILADLPEALPA